MPPMPYAPSLPPGSPALPALQATRAARSLYVPHDPIASLPADAKVKLLERLEGYARAIDPRVVQVMASLAGEYEVILVAGSDGRLAADIRPLVRCSVSVIVEENGKREQGGRAVAGVSTSAISMTKSCSVTPRRPSIRRWSTSTPNRLRPAR